MLRWHLFFFSSSALRWDMRREASPSELCSQCWSAWFWRRRSLACSKFRVPIAASGWAASASGLAWVGRARRPSVVRTVASELTINCRIVQKQAPSGEGTARRGLLAGLARGQQDGLGSPILGVGDREQRRLVDFTNRVAHRLLHAGSKDLARGEIAGVERAERVAH